MAAASSNLTEAEQAFLVYDWANSEKWQSYLMNLYPVPPQDKIVKWKIKFFKAQENADLNPDSSAFRAALAQQYPSASCRARPAAAQQPPHSSSSGWPQPPNAPSQGSRSHSASSARFSTLRKKVLPPLCALGLILGLAVSFVAAATQSGGAFKYSSAGTLLLFFSFLTHLYIVLGKPPYRMADLSSTMSSAFVSYIQQAIVQDSTHAMLYLLLTSTMPRSFPALFSPTISAILVISSLLAARDGFPAFVCGMPLLRKSVQRIQAGVRDDFRFASSTANIHAKPDYPMTVLAELRRFINLHAELPRNPCVYLCAQPAARLFVVNTREISYLHNLGKIKLLHRFIF